MLFGHFWYILLNNEKNEKKMSDFSVLGPAGPGDLKMAIIQPREIRCVHSRRFESNRTKYSIESEKNTGRATVKLNAPLNVRKYLLGGSRRLLFLCLLVFSWYAH